MPRDPRQAANDGLPPPEHFDSSEFKMNESAHNSPSIAPSSHARTTSLDTSSRLRSHSIKHRRESSLSNVLDPSPLLDLPPRTSSLQNRPDTIPEEMAFVVDSAAQQSGWRGFVERNRAVGYVLLAQVFGVLMNVTTRLLEVEGNKGLGMHPFQILFVRMTITTIVSTAYMWWTKVPHFPFGMPEVRWLLLLRAVGGFFGVFGMYYSLLFLPLADATVLTFIAPCVSCFACSLLLKEPFTRMEQLGALISFAGVLLIARPTFLFPHASPNAPPADATDDAAASHKVAITDLNTVTPAQRFSAICVALVGVFGSAMAFTVMRMIGKRASPLLSVNYFCAWCMIVSAVAMLVLPDVSFLLPANTKEWSYLFFLGICGFAMQFLLSAGLQRDKSSRATLMVYTQMLFALFFDKLIFGTNPSILSLAGSSLILSSAIYVAMHKAGEKKRREEEEKARAAQIAGSSSDDVEMQSVREEERRGLVEGMDANDETENEKIEREQRLNGGLKPVG